MASQRFKGKQPNSQFLCHLHLHIYLYNESCFYTWEVPAALPLSGLPDNKLEGGSPLCGNGLYPRERGNAISVPPLSAEALWRAAAHIVQR